MVAGVCPGAAEHFGVDVTLVREPQDWLRTRTRGVIKNCPRQPPCPPTDAPDCK